MTSEDKESLAARLGRIVEKYIPVPIIITVVIYMAILIGGTGLYSKLVSSAQLDKSYIENITNYTIWIVVILTSITIVLCIIFSIDARRRRKISLTEVETYIVGQDDKIRDDKFNEINTEAKKSYWVFGLSLTSIIEKETMLTKKARDGVDIRICMINPEIAVSNLCRCHIEQDRCIIKDFFADIKSGEFEKNNIVEKIKASDKHNDLLSIYHVLIDSLHFSQYYDTVTDIDGKIKSSYESMLKIKSKIENQSGNEHFKLAFVDSFLPISITIADKDEENGKMIVEFHVPFTSSKVMLKLTKQNNNEFFQRFIEFYEKIWERATKNEQIRRAV